MIDFRYHLISIIAVLLSLAIGIFAGSGFLGGPLLDDLEGRVRSLETKNDKYKADNEDLRGELDFAADFAEAVEPMLIENALADDPVVIFEFEGTDSGMVDRLIESVEGAGGVAVSRIILRDKLALEQETDLDQLALVAGSSSDRPREVRRDAALALGSAVAKAGSFFTGRESRGISNAAERLRTLLDQLERAGFLSVEQLAEDVPVVPGPRFVIVGGSPDPAPYDVVQFAATIGANLANAGNGVIVAEPRDSAWGLTVGIRDDEHAAALVATSDRADTVEGRIATVLGLAAAARGEAAHFGTGPGATALIPSPPPASD